MLHCVKWKEHRQVLLNLTISEQYYVLPNQGHTKYKLQSGGDNSDTNLRLCKKMLAEIHCFQEPK